MLGAIAVGALLLAAVPGCATYRDDLARAKFHYNANKYPEALALLELLELDLDSLTKEERAEYAYYRGMSHYRIGERRHARHWLGRADARNSQFEGRLNKEAKKRMDDTLSALNRKIWGEGSASDARTTKCSQDADCSSGYFCDPPRCKSAAKAPANATKTAGATATEKPSSKAATPSAKAKDKTTPATKGSAGAPTKSDAGGKACSQALDCPGAQVCQKGRCVDLGQ